MAYIVDADLKVLDPTDYTRNDPIEGSALVEKLVLNHNLAAVAAGGALLRLGSKIHGQAPGTETTQVFRVQLTEVPALRCTCVCRFAKDTVDAQLTTHLEELDGTPIDFAAVAVPDSTAAAPAVVQVDLDTTGGAREALLYWAVTSDGVFEILGAELAPYPTADCTEGVLSLPTGYAVPLLDSTIPATDLRALDVHTVTALLDSPQGIEGDRHGHFFHWAPFPQRGLEITAEPERVWYSGTIRADGTPIELWVRGECGVATASTATWALRLGNGQTLTLEFDTTGAPTDPEDNWQHATLTDVPPGIWSAVLSCTVVGTVEILSVSLLEVPQ